MMTFFKGMLTPKITLLKKINNLERDVDNLKASYSSLLSKTNGLEKFCQETVESVNSIFFKEKVKEVEKAEKDQKQMFDDKASVFSWEDEE